MNCVWPLILLFVSIARFGDNDMGSLDWSFRSEVVGGDASGVGSGSPLVSSSCQPELPLGYVFSSSQSSYIIKTI